MLTLARDDLRTTLVLLGLVVIMTSAIIRRRVRAAQLRRMEAEEDALASESSEGRAA